MAEGLDVSFYGMLGEVGEMPLTPQRDIRPMGGSRAIDEDEPLTSRRDIKQVSEPVLGEQDKPDLGEQSTKDWVII